MTTDIITLRQGRAGRIRLNRPKAIHALTKDMCTAMIAALVEWRTDPSVEIVLIDHAEGRGFCAGGDVRTAAESGVGDGVEARAFFHEEYRLNHLLFTFVKPIVAFADGTALRAPADRAKRLVGGVTPRLAGAVRVRPLGAGAAVPTWVVASGSPMIPSIASPSSSSPRYSPSSSRS